MLRDGKTNLEKLLAFPIVSVFGSQIVELISEIAEKAFERVDEGLPKAEWDSLIEKFVEEEMNRIEQKIRAGKFSLINLVSGNGTPRVERCEIMRTETFLYDLRKHLIYYARSKLVDLYYRKDISQRWPEYVNELIEYLNKFKSVDQIPPLEEAFTRIIPSVSIEDVFDWGEHVAWEIAKKYGIEDSMESGTKEIKKEEVKEEIENALSSIKSMLEELGGQRVCVITEFNFDGSANCSVLPIDEFLRNLGGGAYNNFYRIVYRLGY